MTRLSLKRRRQQWRDEADGACGPGAAEDWEGWSHSRGRSSASIESRYSRLLLKNSA